MQKLWLNGIFICVHSSIGCLKKGKKTEKLIGPQYSDFSLWKSTSVRVSKAIFQIQEDFKKKKSLMSRHSFCCLILVMRFWKCHRRLHWRGNTKCLCETFSFLQLCLQVLFLWASFSAEFVHKADVVSSRWQQPNAQVFIDKHWLDSLS